MLEIKDLYVSVQGKEILHGINLSIPHEEVHALFDPNGSGKSVMILTVMGYPEYKVTRGHILIDSHDIAELNINERVKAIDNARTTHNRELSKFIETLGYPLHDLQLFRRM